MTESIRNRRDFSYMINMWDDYKSEVKQDYSNISGQVIDFFNVESKLIFPAKSYFVAIIYSRCMEKFFNVDFYESLDDEELLTQDKYFKTYSQDKSTYDSILSSLENDVLDYDSSKTTIEYFKKEFII